MRRILLLSWLLAVAWLLLAADRVEAQKAEALVSSNPPYPLLINDKEVQRLPASAPLGAQVCVAKKIDYTGEVERYVFKGWQDGPDTECITVTEAREYQAIYAPEVLLQVRSKLRPYARSLWVPRGSLSRLEVPEVVEQEQGSRSRFEEWTGGETPFSPENILAVVRPMVLEVKWTREYFLTLQGPEGVPLVGGGWHRENQPIVLRAPVVYFQGDKIRLKFVGWEGVSNPALMIPDAQARITTFASDAPHVISARYQKEYLVVVQTPLGTLKKTWVPEGEEFVVEVPPLIESGSDRERYRFSAFEGSDLKTPRASLVVDGPMVLTALYERQFMVKVSAPYGAKGDGWYAEGATATIEVPHDLGGVLFLRRVFNGFPGYLAMGPTLDVPVTGPLMITASYRTRADLEGLAVIVGVLLIGGLIYVFTQRVSRPREPISKAVEIGDAKVKKGIPFQPDKILIRRILEEYALRRSYQRNDDEQKRGTRFETP